MKPITVTAKPYMPYTVNGVAPVRRQPQQTYPPVRPSFSSAEPP